MTTQKTCDFCSATYSANYTDWGTISMGLKFVGKRPLEDICGFCTFWLYDVAEIRRKLVVKLNQYDKEINHYNKKK